MKITTLTCEIHHDCIIIGLITVASEISMAVHLRSKHASALAEDLLQRVRDTHV